MSDTAVAELTKTQKKTLVKTLVKKLNKSKDPTKKRGLRAQLRKLGHKGGLRK